MSLQWLYPTTYDGLLEISREEESNPPEIDGTVEKLCEGASVEDGLAVRGRTAQNERDSAESAVTDWLRGLGYIE